ncbi:DSD1 family PLP-dependent enzyme [Phenylobacterium sp.]|jgi:D-serine deaminase-like pyridoxal phosphate-dependent protein|uniref:DSD1 family PLP-dependent enzyme n=1 Tax=Phenylobacterium sp. TaxID=1871053 RepID=UPI000C90FCE8|nr:DSD1 family PLP-dependent enzyme [Phenylobacterium sp.]MAK81418.1 threonine aldolase [Phenylobacterium sp.]|tara:strand:- start:9302 stop:10453 length:1152 start_codon:yes stop_codon:yes gene_type:complete
MSVLSDDRRLHGHLIGQQGSRRALNTPVLVLDLDVLEANIAAMAQLAAKAGVRLRPHAKTHKSVDIARRQVAAGAFGLCCAKLGEAEALAEGDIENLHITSPVVSAPAIARLIALNARSPGLSVVADHPDNVAALAAAASPEAPLSVFVDIDPGIRRTGVASDDAAVALARQIAEAPSLTFGGVQKYCGREQHIEDYGARREAILAQSEALKTTIAALTEAGLAPPVVTGGGTGTHRIDLELGVFNELQVGSYVFMDDQYVACQLEAEPGQPYGRSLSVEARVVSANHAALVTVDAGFKAFSTDADPPQVLGGAGEGARFAFMGDEHGAVIAPGLGETLKPGDLVTLAVPHCDPTVNLYESYHVVRGDALVDIWPVSARGRSR